MIHPLCQSLIETASPRLQDIQHSFDAYQQACFVERSAEFFALELCGEAGELANLVKKRWKGSEISQDRVAEEAADVLIALMNFCNASKVDLGTAVAAKLAQIKPSK
ncbi:MAG: hypothetical protein FGM24_10545 [Candidatus Kapabacteria bacterium]|nr:hypothetical protein [Candidatus Kapabacteria bacterium]